MNFHKSLGLFGIICLCRLAGAAEVIPIGVPAKAASYSKTSTVTKLFPAEHPATATLLFIPGGDGQVPAASEPGESKSPWFNGIFGPLFKSTINVVVVSNPYAIDERSGRPGDDRLDRIESAVRFYKTKFNVPIYLLGHSNGAAAVMEFANRSPENRQLVAGVILSSARKDYSLNADALLPVLILHHKDDSCISTPYSSAVARYEKLKQAHPELVKFATIDGGQDGTPPCFKGHHMYDNSYQSVSAALGQYLPSK